MGGESSKIDFGKDLGLLHEAVVTGREVGASRNFWIALAHNKEMFRKIVELVNAEPIFDITVNYGQSLQEMIEAGKYDYANGDITAKHFPVEGEGDQAKIATLFHFNEKITSKKVIAEMDKKGFRPAMIEDLLALGKTQPELQKQFPIVALGSVWQDSSGYHCVPCLYWGGVGRHLDLDWFGADWSASCRFLALRK